MALGSGVVGLGFRSLGLGFRERAGFGTSMLRTSDTLRVPVR